MATSGSVITNKVDENTYFYVNWQQASQSVAGNYTDINWQHGVNCRYYYGSNAIQSYGVGINGQTVYGGAVFSGLGQGTHELARGTLRIYHDNNGNKTFNVNTSGWVINEGTVSGSQNFTLNSIARFATMTSATNFNDEENPSFTFSNPANASMSCWLEPKPNSPHLAIRTLSGKSGTFTWDLTEEERNQLRAACTDNTSCKCRIGLYSTIGGNTQASFKDMTMTIINANPIFSNFDFNDINPTTLTLTGNSKYNINGYSTVRVSVSTLNKAVAQKGASMSKYQLIIGNETPKEVNYSDDTEVTIDIPNASTGEYKLYAVDSRGNSTLVTKLAQKTIDYTPLSIDKLSSYVERDDGNIGENVTLNYSGSIWNDDFGNVNNAITIARYEYKETNSSTWITYEDFENAHITPTDITPSITENNLSFNGLLRSIETGYIFNVNKSYNFRIMLQDKLSATIVELTPLSSGIPNISLNKEGVGIMCDYNESLGGLLQVGGEVYNNLNDNYSTSEINTGKKWVDDKPIYRKCFYVSSFPNNTNTWFNPNISNIDTVIQLRGFATNSSETINFPSAYSTTYFNDLIYERSGTNAGKIRLHTTSDRRAYSGYVWIEYTKTTD